MGGDATSAEWPLQRPGRAAPSEVWAPGASRGARRGPRCPPGRGRWRSPVGAGGASASGCGRSAWRCGAGPWPARPPHVECARRGAVRSSALAPAARPASRSAPQRSVAAAGLSREALHSHAHHAPARGARPAGEDAHTGPRDVGRHVERHGCRRAGVGAVARAEAEAVRSAIAGRWARTAPGRSPRRARSPRHVRAARRSRS